MARARYLIEIVQEYSIPLIVGVVLGLVVANIDSHFYEELVEYRIFGEGIMVLGHHLTIHYIVNEMFMVFFFGIAAKEIIWSVLPNGPLNPITKAVNPLMGTLGGVLVPAGAYFLLTYIFYGGSDDFSTVARGWAIPTATDIALAWLIARLVFGQSHPAVNFLLLLAVADDAIGLAIIAIYYPDADHPVRPVWLLLTVGGMAVAFAMRRMKVQYWLPYILVGGALSWVGMVKAGIEPALALVVIVPFLPGPAEYTEHLPGRPGQEMGAHGDSQVAHHYTPLEQFEHRLKLFVDMGLFFFAFANAGVSLGNINEVTLVVLLALIGGKTFGITLFSGIALLLGFPPPGGMRLKHVIVTGLVAGLGLTVALFMVTKAFPGPPFREPAKMGAVFSIGVAALALILGAVLKVKDEAGLDRK